MTNPKQSSPKTYKDLIYWQKSFNVVRRIIKLFKLIPNTYDIRIIKSQILRSSMSVCANIAEGYGRFGKKEYSRYLQVSLGSANESECWLLILTEMVEVKFQSEINSIINENTEVIKMLASSLHTLRSK